ncbi:MAG: FecR domain-containing protein [Nostoc sp. NOS(2021)]|uniref:FecR family protein n=1 Tax=Nostoc sp. NOS(2021) TaxID=2815407 RepID=UPI0025FA05B5|nr:FecR family protein [Nostoc sp. NOS(2021)]MBN3894398.1 FecR domain-containing protein [Nostoc sp. NOS(2021)]
MFHKSFPLLVIALWGVIVLPLPNRVNAITPLTRAEIQNLRNLVQLIPRDRQKKRPARKSDAMIPGDGLSTGRASLADLRFNDGSLARVGEQAIFEFLPKTRSFRLSNGTALLLIPPGRGQTLIQTPSAAAAIRGSALFVRYNQQTDTTIVGALTNSGIEVSNKEASQTQVLQAGQMMVIVQGKFQGLYDFDLRNFYETSDLVRGFDLNKQNLTPTSDPAIASVQAETAGALKAQSPIVGEGVVENPSFLQLTTTPSNSSSNNIITNDSPVVPIEDNSVLNSFENTGQVLSNTEQRPGKNNAIRTVNSPVITPVTPPVITPVTLPVITPVTLPVITPVTPPVITPVTLPVITPVTLPVITPVTLPVITPVTPPVITPVTPPVITPVEPPVITPVTPPVITPVIPPVITPVTPPVITPVARPTT